MVQSIIVRVVGKRGEIWNYNSYGKNKIRSTEDHVRILIKDLESIVTLEMNTKDYFVKVSDCNNKEQTNPFDSNKTFVIKKKIEIIVK